VELKLIRIGFQGFTTDFADKVLGTPSSVLLEGGNDPDNLLPIGQMELINDEAYAYYSVKVMSLNL
jgi:hypothetical protein